MVGFSTDSLLVELNHLGLIAGPDENEEQFLQRVGSLNHFKSNSGLEPRSLLQERDWSLAREKTKKLYGINPDWPVAFYSNRSLYFWQGAAAWIDAKRAPLIQLKEGFRKGSYLRMYTREEVLSHELAHACRMGFDEPLFEEVFAFKTSKSWPRQMGGPLFVYSWEAGVLLGSLLISLLANGALLWGEERWWLRGLFYLPWILIGLGGLRLAVLHICLSRAKKKFSSLICNPKEALAVCYRLTDKEIFFFAKNSTARCREYISNQKSLRWRQIVLSYF